MNISNLISVWQGNVMVESFEHRHLHIYLKQTLPDSAAEFVKFCGKIS